MKNSKSMLVSLSSAAAAANMFAANPFITDKWTADPAPLVDGDTLYLFTSHDEAKDGELFHMDDWALFSTKDLKTWKSHPAPLAIKDLEWAKDPSAWASQCVKSPHDGKYYFYFCCISKQEGMCVGVSVADKPTDHFKDAIGKPLVRDRDTPSPYWGNDIDPSVLIDTDGTPWMVWGNPVCYIVKLKKNMVELDGDIRAIPLPNYTEGPWLDKRGKTYYILYPSRAHQGFGEHLDYASAPSPDGPWTYRGRLTGGAWGSYTIHPGLCRFKGRDIVFYHNASLSIKGVGGATGRRCVCAEWAQISTNGPIAPFEQTKEGLDGKRGAENGDWGKFKEVPSFGAKKEGFKFVERGSVAYPQPSAKKRAEGRSISDFVYWVPGYAYASIEKPFMESPDCDGFNMNRGERGTVNGERDCVISEEFVLERDLSLSRIGFYLTDGEGGEVRFALREKDGAELLEVPVDYAPQGFGLAFIEISAKRRPSLKAGKTYVLEMRGEKGSATCYWRRSRDGAKHHAFALYGAE